MTHVHVCGDCVYSYWCMCMYVCEHMVYVIYILNNVCGIGDVYSYWCGHMYVCVVYVMYILTGVCIHVCV